jgi:hypothetical protein
MRGTDTLKRDRLKPPMVGNDIKSRLTVTNCQCVEVKVTQSELQKTLNFQIVYGNSSVSFQYFTPTGRSSLNYRDRMNLKNDRQRTVIAQNALRLQ